VAVLRELFQFLIGSLQTEGLAFDEAGDLVFQFLIGSLQTIIIQIVSSHCRMRVVARDLTVPSSDGICKPT